MNKRLILSITLFLIAISFFSFIQENETPTDETSNEDKDELEIGLEPGNLAPDFELSTITGETVRLSDFRGEKILLNFWATWCPPCRAEMPDMQQYHEDGNEGIILAVNLTETEDSLEEMEEFLDEFGITFQVLIDETSEVTNTYNAFALPTSFLINSEGVIHKQLIGAINYELIKEQFGEMK